LAGLLADADRRAALGRAAVRRAEQFSWAASAREHHHAYQRAAAQGVAA
jgi:hypothetical protein